MAAILLTLADTTPNAAETLLITLLGTFGHTVTTHRDTDTAPSGYEDDFDMLIVGYQANGTHDSAFVTASIPVLVLRADQIDDFELASSSGSSVTADADRYIETGHAVIATLGWSTGVDRTLFDSTHQKPYHVMEDIRSWPCKVVVNQPWPEYDWPDGIQFVDGGNWIPPRPTPYVGQSHAGR